MQDFGIHPWASGQRAFEDSALPKQMRRRQSLIKSKDHSYPRSFNLFVCVPKPLSASKRTTQAPLDRAENGPGPGIVRWPGSCLWIRHLRAETIREARVFCDSFRFLAMAWRIPQPKARPSLHSLPVSANGQHMHDLIVPEIM